MGNFGGWIAAAACCCACRRPHGRNATGWSWHPLHDTPLPPGPTTLPIHSTAHPPTPLHTRPPPAAGRPHVQRVRAEEGGAAVHEDPAHARPRQVRAQTAVACGCLWMRASAYFSPRAKPSGRAALLRPHGALLPGLPLPPRFPRFSLPLLGLLACCVASPTCSIRPTHFFFVCPAAPASTLSSTRPATRTCRPGAPPPSGSTL